eukprot:g39198.t1
MYFMMMIRRRSLVEPTDPAEPNVSGCNECASGLGYRYRGGAARLRRLPAGPHVCALQTRHISLALQGPFSPQALIYTQVFDLDKLSLFGTDACMAAQTCAPASRVLRAVNDTQLAWTLNYDAIWQGEQIALTPLQRAQEKGSAWWKEPFQTAGDGVGSWEVRWQAWIEKRAINCFPSVDYADGFVLALQDVGPYAIGWKSADSGCSSAYCHCYAGLPGPSVGLLWDDYMVLEANVLLNGSQVPMTAQYLSQPRKSLQRHFCIFWRRWIFYLK